MAADIQSLEALQNLAPTAIVIKAEQNHMRLDSLREVAIGLGARAGLAHKEQEIEASLEKRAPELDTVFNFRALMISDPSGASGTTNYMILPPVITEADGVYEIPNPTVIRVADKTYRIEQQAKFVSVAPTWRDYLVHQVIPVEQPHSSLLPASDDERKAWKQWIADGWKLGEDQADAIFANGLSTLKRDIEGISRYRVLLNAKMVSRPFVAESRNGITGGGSDLAIDDRTLMITAQPALNKNSGDWNAHFAKNRQAATSVAPEKIPYDHSGNAYLIKVPQ